MCFIRQHVTEFPFSLSYSSSLPSSVRLLYSPRSGQFSKVICDRCDKPVGTSCVGLCCWRQGEYRNKMVHVKLLCVVCCVLLVFSYCGHEHAVFCALRPEDKVVVGGWRSVVIILISLHTTHLCPALLSPLSVSRCSNPLPKGSSTADTVAIMTSARTVGKRSPRVEGVGGRERGS